MDADRADGTGGVWHAFYRVQWPGDGTFRVGGSGYREPRASHPAEPFDWGGRLFLPKASAPEPPPNHLGFSAVRYAGPDAWGAFVGVPAWLPAALCALPGVHLGYGRRRATQP